MFLRIIYLCLFCCRRSGRAFRADIQLDQRPIDQPHVEDQENATGAEE